MSMHSMISETKLRAPASSALEVLRARWQRARQWEFWPRRVFYLPMVPVGLLLAIRFRSLTAFTAANPAIPHGGVVGESKISILRDVPAHALLRHGLIQRGSASERLARFRNVLDEQQITLPCIIKPDVGERGCGVRLVTTEEAAIAVLSEQHGAMIVQEYHAGPVEVGVAYVRYPRDACGRITSITTKVQPCIFGDGVSTIEQLIDADERLVRQRAVFAKRFGHRLQQVLPEGHRFTLAVAGNHCQGAMFLDGSSLMTPALEAAIDDIAKSIGGGKGFYMGRFDVRCGSIDELRQGQNIKVLEINGVLGESTNIYDPSFSLLRAYRVLTRQWTAAFAIGAENVRSGAARATPWRQLLKIIREHQRRPGGTLISD